MNKEEKRIKYVISACLLGIPCRWNKKPKVDKKALNIFLRGKAIPLCPELLAGLPTPRPACEIIGGDGKSVLSGEAKVKDQKRNDYSKTFIIGAEKALNIVKKMGIKEAILKSGSPSCGAFYIYSGDFSGKKKKGIGVFTALLKKEGIKTVEV
ncbi:MAG: DUF523 domain-containing protein [Parcubacteria group bacterium]|nr:DUF523 domain-containing protein [Parcubacteria group bacterium]